MSGELAILMGPLNLSIERYYGYEPPELILIQLVGTANGASYAYEFPTCVEGYYDSDSISFSVERVDGLSDNCGSLPSTCP